MLMSTAGDESQGRGGNSRRVSLRTLWATNEQNQEQIQSFPHLLTQKMLNDSDINAAPNSLTFKILFLSFRGGRDNSK